MIQRFFLVLLMTVGLSGPAAAVTVSGLYSVEVPVATSQPDDLKQGYAEGLRRVFLRVSGTRDVLQTQGVEALLADAESLLQSYQFLRADAQDGQNRLRMTFGAVGVNRALASLDAPVWGANRPLTLAWVAVEEHGDRQLVVRPDDSALAQADAGAVWQQAFLSAAASRGLPVTLPPARFQGDRELLSEIWGQFMGSVRNVSGELDHDLISVVRVRRSGGQWRAGWVFEGRGFDESDSSVVADSPEELAARITGRWADLLAAKYAVAAGDVSDSPQVDIVIDGVNTLDDYARINAVLQDLTPVLRVGAVRVKSDQATMRVAFSGELEQLKEYIALDVRFVPLSDQDAPVKEREFEGVGEKGDQRGDQRELKSRDSAGSTDTGELGAEASFPDNVTNDPLFKYQPLMVDEQESEQMFESLYQVLRYRWQSAPVIESGRGN